MITKPSANDPFGYDEAGRPVACKLDATLYCFGYEICQTLKSLIDHGCRATAHMTKADNQAALLIYDPKSKRVEVWESNWTEDEPGIYSITNGEQVGLLSQSFPTFDDVRAFARLGAPEFYIEPGQLVVGHNDK